MDDTDDVQPKMDGVFVEGVAEILDYDQEGRQLFVTNVKGKVFTLNGVYDLSNMKCQEISISLSM
ncbi:hypothetical protein [Desulfosediminicola flagellatus]|uniref:hypothetical protein n=1 Tax=Desulfosediminicola flagellatus TaxID=2569541 RepID=UPI0010ACE168|nr:hypothetical protein [Desulfosediminicola flagellatus]